MNLEAAYQLSKVPPRDEKVAREARLRERFPVREMVERGWIKASKSFDELEKSVLAYFQVPRRYRSDPVPPCGAPQRWGGLVYGSVCLAGSSASASDRASRAEVLRAKARAAIPEIERHLPENRNQGRLSTTPGIGRVGPGNLPFNVSTPD